MPPEEAHVGPALEGPAPPLPLGDGPPAEEVGGTDTPTKDELAAWPRRPRIGWERSRDQVMCRSGKSGAGSTKKITFQEAGGEKKAWRLAEKWLEEVMKEYNAFIKK